MSRERTGRLTERNATKDEVRALFWRSFEETGPGIGPVWSLPSPGALRRRMVGP
jgi:hypothetical protein